MAGLLLVAILIGAGAGYLFGNANTRTVTSTSTAGGPTVTLTSAATLMESTTLIQTSTTVLRATSTATMVGTTTTTVLSANGRWYGLNFMVNDSNCAIGTNPPTTWYEVPCFGSTSNPVIFNCVSSAATQRGCTLRVNTTGQNAPQPSGPNYFTVTVWYPYINYTYFPGLNCRYTVPSVPTPPGPMGLTYAYCISINATSFIIAEQAPPPV